MAVELTIDNYHLQGEFKVKYFGVQMAIRSMSVQILAAKSEEQKRRYTATWEKLMEQSDSLVRSFRKGGLDYGQVETIKAEYLKTVRLSAEMTKEAYNAIK